MKQDTLAEAVALLEAGLQHPPTMFYTRPHSFEQALRTVLAALRTDGEANSRAVPAGEAVELAWRLGFCSGAARTGAIPPRVADVSIAWENRREKVHERLAALSASKPDDASALLKAAVDLRDDLLNRAEWDGDAKVVVAGAGAWFRFNEAIDASIGRDGA